VKHILVGGKQLYLVLHKRRFWCKHCNSAFVEELSGLSKWSRHTNLLADEILERLKETSFAGVTRTTNLSYRVQAQTLLTRVNPSTPKWDEINKPFIMGLDEQSFSGRDMIATITDLSHHKLLCVLPDDHKVTLTKFYESIPIEKVSLIKAICTDMRVTYDTARADISRLADIPLVIDKYHLIADANKRVLAEKGIVEEVILHRKNKIPRKLLLKGKEHLSEEEQHKLKLLLTNYPDLSVYYFIKEGLRELYTKPDKKVATRFFNDLISTMYDQQEKGCSDWAKTLERHYDPILNYFDFRITNAYTEGVHTKMKLIKRQGFGYRNKEIYLRKLVLGFLPLAALMSPHLF
jgi:transposase